MVITMHNMIKSAGGFPTKTGPNLEPTNALIPVSELPSNAINVKIASDTSTIFQGTPFFPSSVILKICFPSTLIKDHITKSIIQIPLLPIAFNGA